MNQRPSFRNSPRLLQCAHACLALTAAALLVSASLAPRPAMAQDAPGSPAPARTISVTGVGKVRVEPDIARINIGVDLARPTVAEASAANKKIVDEVIQAIKDAGVAEKDVQTSGFTIYMDRFGGTTPVDEENVQYRVSNTVAVVVRDLTKVSEVLETAINAGANSIYGVEFAVGDPTEYESEAMAGAVDNANAKAAELAKLTGLTLGKILSVSEGVSVNPLLAGTNQSLAFGAGAGPTVQPGVLELTLQLQVVYAAE